jgi:hypothetical protein
MPKKINPNLPLEANEEAKRFLRERGWQVEIDDLGYWSHPLIEDGIAKIDIEAAIDIEHRVDYARRKNPLERIADLLEDMNDKLDNIAGCLVDLNK